MPSQAGGPFEPGHAADGRVQAGALPAALDAVGGVTDEAWANAAKHYDEDQLAALMCAIAFINAFNRGFVMVQQPPAPTSPASPDNEELLAGAASSEPPGHERGRAVRVGL